jgi:hypothetical protein
MVTLYVEGGGETAALKTACRKGFTAFITKAGISKRPRIVACGSRADAFDSYCTAVANGQPAVLLVDSEGPIAPVHQQGVDATQWQPWHHLKNRPGDGWDKPAGVPDTDCHLMVQCMESWLIVDRATLSGFFGQGFQANQLPAIGNPSEGVAKANIYASLANATKNCKTKSQYGKGEHSFQLLADISPRPVIAASPWAKRFVEELKKTMDAAP